ncbi:TAXI family TRAP transporter solute-binding subunit [Leucobacter sp. cx-42]|uniref:TAXI family TRAP transporter solute-binding subunit n=1 Tax=unclassified Leucobacter TaxID=2621730 RepID=UPI00165E2E01|nr:MULTISPECIES: TAXI family TRAP transporter solute-binding subunit [unclassified Leucobacter]MBC9953459.1 TAXI family TRAP transporter solute-binding subunit [Leucobacter sp. cx-42]
MITHWVRRLTTAAVLCVGLLLFTACAAPHAPGVIAGGNPGGVYHAYGTALANELSARTDREMTLVETDGSVDNLQRIGRGEALLGFAQGDTVADALAGEGDFAEPLELAAVARLYDEYVHIVVAKDSSFVTLADLADARISLGSPGSGVQVIAHRILEAAGMSERDIGAEAETEADTDIDTDTAPRWVTLGTQPAAEALRAGEIDAFFWVGAIPTPGVADLAAEFPIRILPVTPEILDQLNADHADVYGLSELPRGTYGIEDQTRTMTIPNYLVTAADADRGEIREVTETLFAERAAIARKAPVAALLDTREAIFTDPMPLHPGAADYFRSQRR